MFKDNYLLQKKEQVYAIADMGLIDGYHDGFFRPHGTVTRGAYCKLLYHLVAGNRYWAQVLSYPLTGTWSNLQNAVFGRYIGFLGCLIDKNSDISGEWGQHLRAEKFDPSSTIRKKEALLWLHFICQVCYKLKANQYLVSIPPEDEDAEATREWISSLLYIYCAEVVRELKESSNGDRHIFFELWSKCGDNIDHVFGPNPEILRVFEKCSSNEYEMLTYSADRLATEKIPVMYDLLEAITPISTSTLICAKKAYQYTSLNALKSMLDEYIESREHNLYEQFISNIEGPYFRLHMSNAEFLNDPDEGAILKMNFKINNPIKAPQSEEEIYPRQEYISCLTIDDKERLPMWVQYGDGGRGCRIEFEITSENEFHKVTYTPRNALPGNVLQVISNIEDLVSNYYKENPKDSQDTVYCWAKDLLQKFGYYFKDEYYVQEQEIRSIVRATPQNIRMWKKPRNGEIFPRSYVLLEKPLKVKSVMLGPKCINQEQIAVALQNMGIKRIFRSNIHFQ